MVSLVGAVDGGGMMGCAGGSRGGSCDLLLILGCGHAELRLVIVDGAGGHGKGGVVLLLGLLGFHETGEEANGDILNRNVKS